jgi:hypothetical protein
MTSTVAQRARVHWMFVFPLALALASSALLVAQLISWAAGASSLRWTVITPILIGVGQIVLARQQLRSITVSADGVRWRGLGWSRAVSWSDLKEVGLRRPGLGRALGQVEGTLRAGASPSSEGRPPRTVRADGHRLVLAPLTQRGDAAMWDIGDDALVAAIREQVGDRWVDDLSELPRPTRPEGA